MLKRKERIPRNQSHNSGMSSKTRDFIQKICYRKTASVDMTQYGFISDSKVHKVNLLLRPLRERLEKICGKIDRSVRKPCPAKGCKKSNRSSNDKKDRKKKQKHSNKSGKKK